MSLDKRLDIRDKCLRVNTSDSCLVIKAGKLVYGESFIMCVQGDERVLANAFDEYLATDVFNHYVRCRDVNYLKDTTTKEFEQQDVLGLQMNFIHTAPGESATLQVKTDTSVARITTSVTGTSDEPVFEFGSGANKIQFTKPEQRRVKIDDTWFFVTFVSFHTAVFTIDRITDTLIPAGSVAAIDDLIGEIVIDDPFVPEVSTTYGKLDELIAEFVLEVPTPPDQIQFKTMFDELIGEFVISDGSLDFFGPTHATICDISQVALSPSPTPSTTPSISVTPTLTPSNTPSITVSPSVTITPTLTPSATITPTLTPSNTPSITTTPSVTPSLTVTPSITVTPSLTPSVTITPSITPPFWLDVYEPCSDLPEPKPKTNPNWCNVYVECEPPQEPPYISAKQAKDKHIWKNVYVECS